MSCPEGKECIVEAGDFCASTGVVNIVRSAATHRRRRCRSEGGLVVLVNLWEEGILCTRRSWRKNGGERDCCGGDGLRCLLWRPFEGSPPPLSMMKRCGVTGTGYSNTMLRPLEWLHCTEARSLVLRGCWVEAPDGRVCRRLALAGQVDMMISGTLLKEGLSLDSRSCDWIKFIL